MHSVKVNVSEEVPSMNYYLLACVTVPVSAELISLIELKLDLIKAYLQNYIFYIYYSKLEAQII